MINFILVKAISQEFKLQNIKQGFRRSKYFLKKNPGTSNFQVEKKKRIPRGDLEARFASVASSLINFRYALSFRATGSGISTSVGEDLPTGTRSTRCHNGITAIRSGGILSSARSAARGKRALSIVRRRLKGEREAKKKKGKWLTRFADSFAFS